MLAVSQLPLCASFGGEPYTMCSSAASAAGIGHDVCASSTSWQDLNILDRPGSISSASARDGEQDVRVLVISSQELGTSNGPACTESAVFSLGVAWLLDEVSAIAVDATTYASPLRGEATPCVSLMCRQKSRVSMIVSSQRGCAQVCGQTEHCFK